MSERIVDHYELVNALSGIVALCDVTLAQVGTGSPTRKPLALIREAAGRLLDRKPSSEPPVRSELRDRTVVVMDDDALALLTLEHQLRSLGLLVLAAQSPEMAEKLVSLVTGNVDVLFWGLHGSAPARVPRAELPVAYVTDAPQPDLAPVLERPVELVELQQTILELLANRPAAG